METTENISRNVYVVGNQGVYTEIYGDKEQIIKMFSDWSSYIGEVTNPLKTAANYNKGNYAPLDEVLNATRPVLSKYGFGVIQVPTFEESNLQLQTIITHNSGAMMVFPYLNIPIVKADAQTIIAGCTYARRGALNAILGIYGENDDDGNAASGVKSKKTKAAITGKVSPELAAAREKTLEVCRKMSEKVEDKDSIYAIVVKHSGGSRNPNALPTVEACNAVMEEVKSLPVKE